MKRIGILISSFFLIHLLMALLPRNKTQKKKKAKRMKKSEIKDFNKHNMHNYPLKKVSLYSLSRCENTIKVIKWDYNETIQAISLLLPQCLAKY